MSGLQEMSTSMKARRDSDSFSIVNCMVSFMELMWRWNPSYSVLRAKRVSST